uniref:CRAL-TRIO domain-containing protein n=1 Tax=Odontella aurita TaxID=265563 RepID=A0A6U6F7H9_9STRA|mmetsp:Transcript_32152/g.96336  ORF Transcript_32152/g.96336 Transcript_32152/m.96336 type:complete len:585 (+) Transcript_32152:651-2405(+)|eukprot:CAMPEP_0113581830 /NCGR_PEP_ID=MMETSP0015_2-20120614/31542_1 /TAXON_ID=2838 /ORGANISM="Odontella" /LENGTH=584 /DNA_ID=CAMNT_0000486365 /DNA_START=216 /DNA_END=1970 /DNA_ORIENTATION=- /assembly_acc=CAM_ASM_000160
MSTEESTDMSTSAGESGHGSGSSDAGSAGSEPSTVFLRAIIRDALLKGERGNSGGDGDGIVLREGSTPVGLNRQGSDASDEVSAFSLGDAVNVDTQMKLLTADLVGEDIDMTLEERKAVYSAIHGRCPKELETAEDRIDELEREIWKLPSEEKGPILRVLQKNPMLFTVSSQAKLFLYGENFNAARAAQRMAHYWAKREQLYDTIGEDVYKAGDVRGPSLDDYIRFYIRSEEILEDPEVDSVSREIALQFIRCVRKSKVAAVNQQVIEAVKEKESLAPFLEECGLVRNFRSDSPHVSGSDQFKMTFLRSENFNEVMAAGRLMQHWSMKFELFGTSLASKEIRLGDMEDSSEVMKLGFIRLMPGVDKFGRVVVVFNMKALTDALDETKRNEMHDHILKTIWYVISAAAEQSKCQKNGLVFLANLRGGNADLLRQFNIRAEARRILLRCMPVRVKAFHFFFPPSESWWQSMIYALFKYAEPLYKKHAVIHAGTSQEQELSELAACGITTTGLPTELGGEVDFKSHEIWLEERRSGKVASPNSTQGAKRVTESPQNEVISPAPSDAAQSQNAQVSSGSRRRRRPRQG